jgi:hypothetical protein
MIKKGRKLEIGIKTSWNLPPPRVIQRDIEMLKRNKNACSKTIKGYKREIKNKIDEKEELEKLAINPGIYNAEACAKAAVRCDKHLKVFEAVIKKERAKIAQLDSMIKELKKRLWLSEQTLRSTGKQAQE